MGEAEQSVVVGYDGSPVAEAAVTWAAAEAARRGEPLVVLVATSRFRQATDLLSVSGVQGGTWEEEGERLASAGADLARAAVPSVEVQISASRKGPVAALCDAALGASLVVVGSTGQGRVTHALLGSVAFAVMTHSAVSVVAVPSKHLSAAGRDHPIVVGADGSAGSDAAVDQAAAMASDAGAELLVVSAWENPLSEYWSRLYLDDDEWRRSEIDRVRDGAHSLVGQAQARVETRHPGLSIRQVVQKGRPEQVLTDADDDAALVVVGARGQGDYLSLLLGSVSRSVVQKAHCPVAIIR